MLFAALIFHIKYVQPFLKNQSVLSKTNWIFSKICLGRTRKGCLLRFKQIKSTKYFKMFPFLPLLPLQLKSKQVS